MRAEILNTDNLIIEYDDRIDVYIFSVFEDYHFKDEFFFKIKNEKLVPLLVGTQSDDK